MSQFDTITSKKLSHFENVYKSLKVNRFICKNWGKKLTLSLDEINQMIRHVYMDEMQSIRNLHHRTEV